MGKQEKNGYVLKQMKMSCASNGPILSSTYFDATNWNILLISLSFWLEFQYISGQMFQSKRLEDLIGLDISYEDGTETKYSSKTDLGF